MIGFYWKKKKKEKFLDRSQSVFDNSWTLLFQFIILFTFGQQLRKTIKLIFFPKSHILFAEEGRPVGPIDWCAMIEMTMGPPWGQVTPDWFLRCVPGERESRERHWVHLLPIYHLLLLTHSDTWWNPVIRPSDRFSNILRSFHHNHWGSVRSSVCKHEYAFDLLLYIGNNCFTLQYLLITIFIIDESWFYPILQNRHYYLLLLLPPPTTLLLLLLLLPSNIIIVITITTGTTLLRLLLLLVRHQSSHLVSQAAATHEGIHAGRNPNQPRLRHTDPFDPTKRPASGLSLCP